MSKRAEPCVAIRKQHSEAAAVGNNTSVAGKAHLCIAIVLKQYEGKGKPRDIENKGLRLMSLPDKTLDKMARELGVTQEDVEAVP